MVEKTELYKIGHVTYLFDGNFMLNSKIMSKMIFGLTSDDQSVVKSGQKVVKSGFEFELKLGFELELGIETSSLQLKQIYCREIVLIRRMDWYIKIVCFLHRIDFRSHYLTFRTVCQKPKPVLFSKKEF